MDLAEIRRQNLRSLIETKFEGRQVDFVRGSGESQSEVSGILTGRKSFGEKKARKIEIALGLPQGWFDQGAAQSPTLDLDSVSEAELIAAIAVLQKVLHLKQGKKSQSDGSTESDVVSFSVGRPKPRNKQIQS